MARINDGGNFGDDPFAKLIAMRQGGSASLSDLEENEQLNQDAIDMASGMMGTVNPVSKFKGVSNALGKIAPEAEQAAMSMKDRIAQAVQKSKVKNIPSAQDAEIAMFREQAKSTPKNFFEKSRERATQNMLEGAEMGRTPGEMMQEQMQQRLRDEAFAERAAKQLQETKDIPFQMIKKSLQK